MQQKVYNTFYYQITFSRMSILSSLLTYLYPSYSYAFSQHGRLSLVKLLSVSVNNCYKLSTVVHVNQASKVINNHHLRFFTVDL